MSKSDNHTNRIKPFLICTITGLIIGLFVYILHLTNAFSDIIGKDGKYHFLSYYFLMRYPFAWIFDRIMGAFVTYVISDQGILRVVMFPVLINCFYWGYRWIDKYLESSPIGVSIDELENSYHWAYFTLRFIAFILKCVCAILVGIIAFPYEMLYKLIKDSIDE